MGSCTHNDRRGLGFPCHVVLASYIRVSQSGLDLTIAFVHRSQPTYFHIFRIIFPPFPIQTPSGVRETAETKKQGKIGRKTDETSPSAALSSRRHTTSRDSQSVLISNSGAVSYTHLTLPTNREV